MTVCLCICDAGTCKRTSQGPDLKMDRCQIMWFVYDAKCDAITAADDLVARQTLLNGLHRGKHNGDDGDGDAMLYDVDVMNVWLQVFQ